MEGKAHRRLDEGLERQNGQNISIIVREFKHEDNPEVQKIFYEGMMEMIPDTAFRGLRFHPESLLLYAALTFVCFLITMGWWVVGLAPAVVLCGRYACSRSVIHTYTDLALKGDIEDTEKFYMKTPGYCRWVAVHEDKVVGLVESHQITGGVLELRRMSVDQNFRQCGVGVALAKKLLEFAMTHRFSSVVLGTTAYSHPAHRLYQRLGFRLVGVTNGYFAKGFRASLLEKVFYRVRHHHYKLDLHDNLNKVKH
ncbi:N-acetylaspartate synthetase-like [Genypterus blacodes]|uniref:N-acetylaspartate synthetase-like n=1 Tax=Genypterus blacodes TaxID=154954 RepID=UPI003F765852